MARQSDDERRMVSAAPVLADVRYWHKADIRRLSSNVCFWVKRTSRRHAPMSAFDPKRKFGPEDCCCAK
jgi:hypothetical protein